MQLSGFFKFHLIVGVEIKKKNTRYNDTMFSKFNNQNIVYVLLHEQVKKVFI
jgi:hypothetical protein